MPQSIFEAVEQQQVMPANKVSSMQSESNYLKALASKQEVERKALLTEQDTKLKQQQLSRTKKALNMVSNPLSESQWNDVLQGDPVFYYSDDAANLRKQHRAILGLQFYS